MVSKYKLYTNIANFWLMNAGLFFPKMKCEILALNKKNSKCILKIPSGNVIGLSSSSA